MRTVYDAANLIDAHLVRQALEAEGIPAFVRGEALIGGMGDLGVFGLVAVLVPDAAWTEARALVDDLNFGGIADDDTDADDATGEETAG
ncbi:DUF2007 domain-containing protein [Thermomonas carbonis]|uniref:DUF2007 domain-containing protein n=1 Tax=Thermomonas carbonis TaxID=1463158 RepID=A0A7G9SLX2_9GAMM|nr:DUF2007 domain-containing protein [Thermomonas carbonis]QNN68847.1 DUF2007 domain-containing protein [Thermomonas carbonis]GHC08340.1 hypothetical protein GCM10010080_24080 [Thermomonas carbonis]